VLELGLDLIVHINETGLARGIGPISHGSALHTDVMKTQALRQALDNTGLMLRWAAPAATKRAQAPSSDGHHHWDPKRQRPEPWRLYNGLKRKGESMRVFPLSNWTELDVWLYIHQERIPVVPLYFAAPRPVVHRDGMLIMVDDDRLPLEKGEQPEIRNIRFRTLGWYPLTGARAPAIALLQDAMPRPGLPLVHFNDTCCGSVAELRSVILKARRLVDNHEQQRAAAAARTWLLARIEKKRPAPLADLAGTAPDEPFAPERLAA
jgi:3'-phosphoadenosine 5'-phosphosulfate sulfotransferase (PAPS reductase)/FAD synthetase